MAQPKGGAPKTRRAARRGDKEALAVERMTKRAVNLTEEDVLLLTKEDIALLAELDAEDESWPD